MSHILVIRLGALGDLVMCFQTFHEIRQAHPQAEIALLTREAFAPLARLLPWFDRVIIDTHPTLTQPGEWLRLRQEIRDFSPSLVYDLQGKRRQSILYGLLGGPWGPLWSGAAPRCALPRPWPPTAAMHFMDFIAAQLRAASVPASSPVDLGWFDANTTKFALPDRYAVLVPGCSAGGNYKRWPPQHYAALVNRIDVPCVVVGTAADADVIAAIKKDAPSIIDLGGKTTLPELAGVLRHAVCVVGNDTGPVHLAGAVGAPVLALLSGKTNPVWSKPPGKTVIWRQSGVLADLSVDEVVFAFNLLLQHTEGKTRQGKGRP